MGDSRCVKLAVLSDLHATIDPGESWLCQSTSSAEPGGSPVASLVAMIEREHLTADYLVCPGDLGDKAHPASLGYAWAEIHRISKALNVKRVVATPGNHDVDSRYSYNEFDARGHLLDLNPPFPLGEVQRNNDFWANNFTIINEDDCKFLVLNSSAYHGEGRTAPGDEKWTPEFEHGRASKLTIQRIKGQLERLALDGAPRVLVCHHHPHRIEDPSVPDSSEMDGGELLLQALGSGDFGDWIAIHGHRHQARIAYAPGVNAAAVLFGAGSFSSKRLPQSSNAENQFYIIRLERPRLEHLDLDFAGRFMSWSWYFGRGWTPSRESGGLPAKGGFGCREGAPVVARRILSIPELATNAYLTWTDVTARVPHVDYLMPGDMRLLLRCLKESKVRVLCEDGAPSQIARVGGNT